MPSSTNPFDDHGPTNPFDDLGVLPPATSSTKPFQLAGATTVGVNDSTEDALKQQAQIQLQVVGVAGVGVRPDASNLAEDDKLRAELTAKELEQRQKGNAETCQRVASALQKKFSEIDKEARKLAFVKAELAKLDAGLSNNIAVLRGEIEKVGREEAAAQDDFDAKERAYLAARKALAKKKQRKQLLVAHLDHIILNNERQKADKLRELEQHLDDQKPTAPPAVVTFRGFET